MPLDLETYASIVLARMIESVWSNLEILVALAGIWTLVGITLIGRRARAEDESRTHWRYLDPDVQAARGTARAMLLLAVILGFLVSFFWLAAPGFRGGMMYDPPWYEVSLPWVAGAAVYLIGLGWMIRIYRADPEPGETTWRYRSLALAKRTPFPAKRAPGAPTAD